MSGEYETARALAERIPERLGDGGKWYVDGDKIGISPLGAIFTYELSIGGDKLTLTAISSPFVFTKQQ